jgi:hypothetical protein
MREYDSAILSMGQKLELCNCSTCVEEIFAANEHSLNNTFANTPKDASPSADSKRSLSYEDGFGQQWNSITILVIYSSILSTICIILQVYTVFMWRKQ